MRHITEETTYGLTYLKPWLPSLSDIMVSEYVTIHVASIGDQGVNDRRPELS
jgi:hypothetical protein